MSLQQQTSVVTHLMYVTAVSWVTIHLVHYKYSR